MLDATNTAFGFKKIYSAIRRLMFIGDGVSTRIIKSGVKKTQAGSRSYSFRADIFKTNTIGWKPILRLTPF